MKKKRLRARRKITPISADALGAAEQSPGDARLTGGDLDADVQRAGSVGEEAVGGSVTTPDQDRVDETGDALGVARAPDAEVRASAEILEERDRHRLERDE